jgi:pyruvate,orthophosphate dikinase
LSADKIAATSELATFGVEELTNLAFGCDRDAQAQFLTQYQDWNILGESPFQALDEDGVGALIAIGVELARSQNPKIVLGVAGDQLGNPNSILFLHRIGVNYVSCPPQRIPIIRIAAAQAAINEKPEEEVEEVPEEAPPDATEAEQQEETESAQDDY